VLASIVGSSEAVRFARTLFQRDDAADDNQHDEKWCALNARFIVVAY